MFGQTNIRPVKNGLDGGSTGGGGGGGGGSRETRGRHRRGVDGWGGGDQRRAGATREGVVVAEMEGRGRGDKRREHVVGGSGVVGIVCL